MYASCADDAERIEHSQASPPLRRYADPRSCSLSDALLRSTADGEYAHRAHEIRSRATSYELGPLSYGAARRIACHPAKMRVLALQCRAGFPDDAERIGYRTLPQADSL